MSPFSAFFSTDQSITQDPEFSRTRTKLHLKDNYLIHLNFQFLSYQVDGRQTEVDREADRQDSGRLTAEWQTQSGRQEGQTSQGQTKTWTRERQTKRWTRDKRQKMGADKEIKGQTEGQTEKRCSEIRE